MNHRRIAFVFALVAALSMAAPATTGLIERAHADGSRSVKKSDRKKRVSKRSARRARRARNARRARARRAAEFSGRAARERDLRADELPRPTGDVWVYMPNFREEVRVNIYNEDGSFDQKALAALDHAFRCKRTDEERAVDPRLYEVMSIIFDEFGGKRLELVSGFRYSERDTSRHYHASAMDIRIDGVSNRRLYEFARSLDTGGMGIGFYPRSGFIHVDYRAPGEKSYYWTDRSGPDSKKKRKKRRSRRSRPNT